MKVKCKCGCGEYREKYDKNGVERKYIYGHSNRGKNNPFHGRHHTNKTKKILSEKNSGKNSSNYGKHFSEEHCKKIGLAHKGKKVSKETRKKQSQSRKGIKFPKELYPNYGGRNKKHSKESRMKMSKYHRLNRDMESERVKKWWRNPKNVKKMMEAWKVKPNKFEIILNELINQITDDFKYNGDFSQGITIDGRIPDWVNCNGKKQVIEMFGKYWHDPKMNKNVRPERTYSNTTKDYKNLGWSCLIIWDYELKEPDKVLNKIKEFVGDSNVRN